MSAAAQAALEKVHTLYLMQIELWNFLDADLSKLDVRRDAEKRVRSFRKLLGEVDWRYMGGTDVLEELQKVSDEVREKIKQASPKVTMKKKIAVRK